MNRLKKILGISLLICLSSCGLLGKKNLKEVEICAIMMSGSLACTLGEKDYVRKSMPGWIVLSPDSMRAIFEQYSDLRELFLIQR